MQEEKPLGMEINCISNLLRREIDRRTSFVQGDEVSRIHSWILHYIIRHEGQDVFQKDVEKALALTRSNVSKAVDQMVQKGLILRSPVEYDARLKKLTLTDKAWELHRQIEENIAVLEGELTEGFTPEELEQFREYLHRITENVLQTKE